MGDYRNNERQFLSWREHSQGVAPNAGGLSSIPTKALEFWFLYDLRCLAGVILDVMHRLVEKKKFRQNWPSPLTNEFLS